MSRWADAIAAGKVFVDGDHGAGDTVPFDGMKESGIGCDADDEAESVRVTI